MHYARSCPDTWRSWGRALQAPRSRPIWRAIARGAAGAEFEVTLFDGGTRPPIVVGESLVPAVVPFLRRLGIEEEVASYSTLKPGATFRFGLEDVLMFRFAEVRGARTTYSYNVPRDRFDASVRDAALARGRAPRPAARAPRARRIAASACGSPTASLAAARPRRGSPTSSSTRAGRNRQLARLLDLPVVQGDRRDTALHAHLEGVTLINPGDVHTDRLEHGWSWRIPLPGRVSVGLVMDSPVLREFGADAEEQFDTYLRHDPLLSRLGRHREAHLAGGEVHELPAAPHARRRAELGAGRRCVRLHRSGVLERPA